MKIVIRSLENGWLIQYDSDFDRKIKIEKAFVYNNIDEREKTLHELLLEVEKILKR